MKVNMTYSKEYLTKREAFKKLLPAVPVDVRLAWIEKLQTIPQHFGASFKYSPDLTVFPSNIVGCCVLGALRLVEPQTALPRPADAFFEAYTFVLNDKYKATFKAFIKWIRESLKQPVK